MSLPSAAHCDADIGGLERGRVVHAVADPADLIAPGPHAVLPWVVGLISGGEVVKDLVGFVPMKG